MSLLKGKIWIQTCTEGDDVKTQGENGGRVCRVVHLQGMECQGLLVTPEAGRGRKDLPQSHQGVSPCQHWDFSPLAPGTVREHIFDVVSHTVFVICFGSRKKPMQHALE